MRYFDVGCWGHVGKYVVKITYSGCPICVLGGDPPGHSALWAPASPGRTALLLSPASWPLLRRADFAGGNFLKSLVCVGLFLD